VTNNGNIDTGLSALTFGALDNQKTVSLGEGKIAVTSYTGASGSVLAVAIGGTTAGTNQGQLVESGAMTIDGELYVMVGSGYTPPSGTTYTIATYASKTGSFSSVVQGSPGTFNAPVVGSTNTTIKAS
jgi:hypothetical protein